MNNRIYLYCDVCRHAEYLAKCMGRPDYYRSDPMDDATAIGQVFLDFTAVHWSCRKSTLGGAQTVEIRFEACEHDDGRELPPSVRDGFTQRPTDN